MKGELEGCAVKLKDGAPDVSGILRTGGRRDDELFSGFGIVLELDDGFALGCQTLTWY